MRKKIFFMFMLLSSIAFAQVGINTENPKQVFHVDGSKDNPNTGMPNSAQQMNDVVITSSGQIGIGTVTPGAKLDVSGNINVNTNSTGNASSINFYENSSNGTNSVSLKAPSNLSTNRSITLPSNAPSNGFALKTNDLGATEWGPVNPASATLASISLSNASSGSTSITNGGTNGTTVNQRFFQKFDNKVTDPNNRFDINTGTYTVSLSGIYLITAYIMPNAAPNRNEMGFYYPVNLEIRKNCGGNPSAGTNIMDNATIRWATPGQSILRYSVVVTGMVSLSAGDTLNTVIYLIILIYIIMVRFIEQIMF